MKKKKINNKIKIGIIGFGNMATALVSGVLEKKIIKPEQILFLAHDVIKDKKIQKKFSIKIIQNIKELCKTCSVIVLAVKPQMMIQVLDELKIHLNQQLIITIAAGIPTATYHKYLGTQTHVIRVMPNTPALIGLGASGYYATKNVTRSEKNLVESLFGSVGLIIPVTDENLIDTVAAVSGSGPAFVYLYAKSIIDAAQKLGLSSPLARQLTLQTLLGATQMMMNTNEEIDLLITRVASKKGMTLSGLEVLKKKGFGKILFECLKAAKKRAQEMSSLYK